MDLYYNTKFNYLLSTKNNVKMIKAIAFDFVGVLVWEKEIPMTEIEDKIERLFGDLISDDQFIHNARNIIKDKEEIISTAKWIIEKLYEIKNPTLFSEIKTLYPNIKILIASNHVSYIRTFIENNFETKFINDIIISAEIRRCKPNPDFFQYILNSQKIQPSELLFLDDSTRHIEWAKKIWICTIKVEKEMNLLKEIKKVIEW